MTSKPEVIYVGDPMCSWCWGIAPTIERIAERDDVDVNVLVGGLRPGPNARKLDDQMRRELGHHWEKVADVSGQPFDITTLMRPDWVYDTEVPALAVVTMRRHSPGEVLRFFSHLQRAFYAEGVDVTDMDRYPALVSDFAVDPGDFCKEMSSVETRTRTWQEFGEARELGVAGFPTVLLRIDDTIQVLSRGYATPDHFDNLLTYWVEGRQPTSADVGTCSLEGGC